VEDQTIGQQDEIKEQIEYFYKTISWEKVPEVKSFLTNLILTLAAVFLLAVLATLIVIQFIVAWLVLTFVILFLSFAGLYARLSSRNDTKTQRLRDKWVEDRRPEIENLIKETYADLMHLGPLKRLALMAHIFPSAETHKYLQEYLAADPETGGLAITKFVIDNKLLVD
jgi:hypothetical protein